MKSPKPIVSIVMTTYNRCAYLANAIESVLAQTFQDWELTIVDDGSGDATGDLAKTYCQKDARIRYFYQSNQGIGAARNRGLRESSGKYIAFLDDDDQWFPYKLNVQVSFMESHPEIGLSYSQMKIVLPVKNGERKEKLFPPVVAKNFLELLYDCHILPSTVMMRRSCLEGNDWFDPSVHLSEDQDLWLRVAQQTRIKPLESILATTVMDDRSHAAQDYIAVRKNMITLIKKLELTPEYQSHWRLKERHVARIRYELGRDYLDLKNYGEAAKYFVLALLTDPFVGLMVKKPHERGLKLFSRIAKAYVAPFACLLKGISYARR